MQRFIHTSTKRSVRRRVGSIWPWLGLGALGFTVAAILRGERRGSAYKAGPEESSIDESAKQVRFDPPPDTETSWIPGPEGSLRILQRHPAGHIPILFVHGLGGCAEHWSAQLGSMGPGLHGIALDLPGHGGSDRLASGDYSVPALAACLGAVLDALRIRQVILVAHSLGASAAIEYSASHSNRVAGLFLVDPNADQSRLPEAQRQPLLTSLRADPGGELAWNFRQILIDARTDVAERVLAQLALVPEDVTLNTFEGALNYNLLEAIDRYTGPIRAVISDLNTLPISLHRLRPEVPVQVLRGSSHWLMMDRPDELFASLIDFLDELAAQNALPKVPDK